VKVPGLNFPYPGYLANIVRQVALRFHPPGRVAALSADVTFLIRRDGSVAEVRIVRKSGSYAFDLEAQGAVEAAGEARAFGALPDGFRDDVLPVTFSFDPRVLR
jgi:TonB family protein